MDTFMDGKLDDRAKGHAKKHLTPEMMKRYSEDPNFMTKAILNQLYGEQAINQIKKREFKRGRMKSKMSNIPAINGEGVKAGRSAQSGGEGFEAWKT